MLSELKNSPDYSGGFKRGYAPLETEDYVIYVEYKIGTPLPESIR